LGIRPLNWVQESDATGVRIDEKVCSAEAWRSRAQVIHRSCAAGGGYVFPDPPQLPRWRALKAPFIEV
jgi:hypothetical protein